MLLGSSVPRQICNLFLGSVPHNFPFLMCLLFKDGLNLLLFVCLCRSPWSNKYHPPLEDGSLPSSELRKLEIEANDIFAIYRDQWGPLLTSSLELMCFFRCLIKKPFSLINYYLLPNFRFFFFPKKMNWRSWSCLCCSSCCLSEYNYWAILF